MSLFARLFAVLFFFLLTGWTPVASAQRMRVVEAHLDHAVFAGESGLSRLEIYLAFDASSLTFTEEATGFVAELPLYLNLHEKSAPADTASVWQQGLQLRFPVSDPSKLSEGQQLIHQLAVAVPPGDYRLVLRIPETPDAGYAPTTMERDVLVHDFEGGARLSDLLLASLVAPDSSGAGTFHRHGLLVYPNASLLFGQGLPELYYYAEAAGGGAGTGVRVYVAETAGRQPLYGLERTEPWSAAEGRPISGSFDLRALPSGSYRLRMELLGLADSTLAERERKFFVYNPTVERKADPDAIRASDAGRYAEMDDAALAAEFEMASLVATETERRRFKQIEDADERRRFLVEFWRNRDPEPATVVNEFRDSFFQRVRTANERYAAGKTQGALTDRGRVMIKYGPPSSVESRHFDRDVHPHEIWHYHSIPGEGQAVFVFADRHGFGRFDLLHASVAGERNSPSWRDELRR